MTPQRFPIAALGAIGVALVALCLACGDRQGFEGDDVAMLFGIGHLERIGSADVYRYAWQPLAYELLAPFARGEGSAFGLTPIGNVAGALGLTLLVALLTRLLAGVPSPLALGALLVLCVPELLTSALYFNSTAIALPFFAASLLALDAASRRREARPLALLSGVLAATACFVRLDFATAMPFVFAAAWSWSGPARRSVVAAWLLGGTAVTIALIAWRPGLPIDAYAILRGYQGSEFPISRFYSVRTLAATLGPAMLVLPMLAWGLLRSGVPRTAWRQAAVVVPALALAPTLAPIMHLYSGKYLVPFLVCFLAWVARFIAQVHARGQADGVAWREAMAGPVRWSWAVVAVTALAGFPAPAATAAGTVANVFVEPSRAQTHDGPRALGAYLAAARSVRSGGHRPNYVDMWRELADIADACERSLVVVMPTQPAPAAFGWSWTFLPLYLEQRGWRLEDITLTRRARLTKPGTSRVLEILRPGSAPTPASGTAVIDMTQVPAASEGWAANLDWVRGIGRPGPGGLPLACAVRP